MLLLALDSAGAVGSAAICDDAGRTLGYRRGDPRRDQADRLIALIDGLLLETGLDYDAIDVVAVNRGPGSFTGIRAAVAAARALALAAQRPVFAINSLEVVAAILGAQPAGSIVAAMDARRGQVYLQIFDRELLALSPPRALALEDVTLAGLQPPIRLVGNGAHLVRAVLPDDQPTLQKSFETDALGVARRVISRLAAGERPVPGQSVQPLYLRAPDAKLPEPARVRATAGT